MFGSHLDLFIMEFEGFADTGFNTSR